MMNDEGLDRLLEEIREENTPPDDEIRAAQDRVWQKLATRPSVCDEFRPALADYVAGEMDEARRLLTEDHLGRCVDCRRALRELKGNVTDLASRRKPRSPWADWKRWAVAATIVLAAVWVGRDSIDSALAPDGPRATVVSVSGTLHELSGAALDPGAEIAEGRAVRTAARSGAILRLADGSRVEMNQRTELALDAAWSGDTIRLARGDIVVEATDQGSRRLSVSSRDSVATVRGTVFAVSGATAGSLVSVVEGSVEVSQPGFEEVLSAGQQAASSPALRRVAVTEAVAWSSEAEEYYELLDEIVRIEEEVAAMPWPSLRHDPGLLPYLPADTFVYVAIPSLAGTVGEVIDLVDRRSLQSPALEEWWTSDDGEEIRHLLEQLGAATPMLGDEVVFVMSGDPASGGVVPLVLAEVRSGSEDDLRGVIDGFTEAPDGIPHRITDGLLLASDEASHLALLAAQLGAGASSAFAAQIRDRYRRGVGWLAALDLDAMGLDDNVDGPMAGALGLENVGYLFFEQRTGGAADPTEVTLAFDGPRVGMANWLADPGPLGSVEYVSPDAVAASASSTRDPRELFDQLLTAMSFDSAFLEDLEEFEQETGVSLAGDVAASLGTDFVIAIERISIPTPGWVTAVEVLNPAALDGAVRRLVDAINRDTDEPEERASFVQESVGGRTWNSLVLGDASPLFTWTYDRGYLVASDDRGLASRAIGVRDSGSSLIRSSAFQRQYPLGRGLHDSGFFWLNAGNALAELATLTGSPAVAELAGSRDPVLVVVTGEDERIRWASRTRLSSMVLDVLLAAPMGELEGATR